MLLLYLYKYFFILKASISKKNLSLGNNGLFLFLVNRILIPFTTYGSFFRASEILVEIVCEYVAYNAGAELEKVWIYLK